MDTATHKPTVGLFITCLADLANPEKHTMLFNPQYECANMIILKRPDYQSPPEPSHERCRTRKA